MKFALAVFASGWTCGFCNYLNRPEAIECESPMYCKGRGN